MTIDYLKPVSKDETSDDPRDSGCLCQRCGQQYRVDFLLPDALWLPIHGQYNLLCGRCIVELLEAREEFDYFDLTKLDAQPVGRKKSKKIQVEGGKLPQTNRPHLLGASTILLPKIEI
jgi:hypothetical protein